jgi:hypothetical protein
MDFRSLSLNSPSMYGLAAVRWTVRPKQSANASAKTPKRCTTARADPASTRAS